ncbi:MAG: glycosyltransferase, partial [Endomicrobiales bacterium]
ADHFVLALLGPRWEEVVPLLRILCFVGLDHSIGATTDWIYQSQGRTDVMFRWSAVATTLYIASFVIGLRWGVAGVAWAYLICNYAVLWYPSWRVAGRLVGLRPGEVVKAVAPAFIASLTMLMPVHLATLLVPAGAPHAVFLAAGTAAGMAAYAAVIYAVSPEAFGELKELLARRGGGPAPVTGSRGPAVVVHYKYGAFLPLTENWIYSQIHHAARFSPVVYCHSTENLDAYPVEKIRALSTGKGFSLRALVNRCCNRLFRFYPYFAWHLYRDRPSLIHAHFGPSGCAILALKNIFRVPLITTFYGYDLSQLPARDARWKRRYRELFSAGECFLVEGNHMKQCLRELGCPEEKVVVHHLGVDVEDIPFVPRRLKGTGGIRVLMSGTFKEKKGIPCGIEAFAAFRRKHPRLDLRLTLLGDSRSLPDEEREKKKILASIEKQGVRELVSLEGFQPNAVFRQRLYEHHIFLSPSVTAESGDTEGGAPVSLIEAAASGMPVLATAHCDIPETVVNGESGYLVPERDTKALAEKLEALALSPEKWEAMGRRGRQHVEENYDVRKQARRLEEIIETVTGRALRR